MYDIIIIGAGPTGLTAAIYAARRMMKTLVISKNIGGQMVWASEIANYPGVKTIGAIELVQNMSQQVKDFGVGIKIDEVKKIDKNTDGSFKIDGKKQSYLTKTIVLAMGLAPKQLGLARENQLVGKGISYCANCDGPLFKGKPVAVVGGGNAALDAAEVLSKIASQVYLIYHKPKFKGFESLVAWVEARKNIIIMLASDVVEIIGEQKLERLKIENKIDRTVKEIKVDGFFIEIGHTPKTEWLANLVERDEKDQIIVDLSAQTSQAGVFAAGDVTPGEFKQIIIGCSQGAVAALSAYKYLQEKK